MSTDQIDALLNAILDGEASENDIQQLQALASAGGSSPGSVASDLADRIAEHRLLGVLHQPFETEQFIDSVMAGIEVEEQSATDTIMEKLTAPPDAVRAAPAEAVGPHRMKHLAAVAGAAALVFLLLGGCWWLMHQMEDGNIATNHPARELPVKAVATVLLAENCVWAPDRSLDEGQRVVLGRATLERGTAVLRFDSGAELAMAGPAMIETISATHVLVHLGNVVVRASEGAGGFVVTTPVSEVTDLGTEFAVKVNRNGLTEVHVLEGEVSYRRINAPDELVEILQAGEGISIHKDGRPRAVPMNSPRFRDYIRRVNPRSRTDLLTAYEGFNYSPGALPLAESTVGTGWAGPWRKRKPSEQKTPSTDTSPDHLEIVHGQMNVAWPVPGGRMGMLKLPPGRAYYVRQLKNAIKLDQDQVTFFSMMVRELERPTEPRRPRERVRLTFRSKARYYSQFISFGQTSSYQPCIRTGDGVLHCSAMVLPAGHTTLWTGKIVARAHGEDEIYFRVYGEDDPLGYGEPATWHVVTRGVELDSPLDCVLLSSEGTTPRIIDELRIGPTWRSVAPVVMDH